MFETQKPLVIVFLGSIGAGKSFFARQLAATYRIARINSDAMRFAMGETWGEKANRRLWGAGDYAVEQILTSGQHVIYDAARFNRLEARRSLYEITEKIDAVALVIWIETPREVAAERAATRELTDDQKPFTREEVEEIIDRHEERFNPPEPYEKVIKIDGQAPFDDQLASFTVQLKDLAL